MYNVRGLTQKNIWRNSFQRGCTFKEITTGQNGACDFSKHFWFLFYEGFSIFNTDLKGI